MALKKVADEVLIGSTIHGQEREDSIAGLAIISMILHDKNSTNVQENILSAMQGSTQINYLTEANTYV